MRSNNIRSFPAVDNSTHFLSLLTNTPFEGILAVDTHGIIRFVNDFFVDLIQQERSQLLGAPISKVLPDCRLGDTLARGYSEWGDLLTIQGKEVYTCRFPLTENGILVGAMLKTVFPDMMVGRSIAEHMIFLGRDVHPIPQPGRFLPV